MADTTTPTPPLSKRRVFIRRLSSTLLLWGIVLGAMFSGHKQLSDFVVLGLMLLLSFSGLYEFYGLIEKRGLPCFKYFGLIGGLLFTLFSFFVLTHQGSDYPYDDGNNFDVAVLIFFLLGLLVRQLLSKTNPNGFAAIATTLFGLMYVPWLLNFILKINFFQSNPSMGDGKFLVLYVILVTKFSDTGAYVVGSLIGRHKMIPRISPGKTWEGFVGAIGVSTAASVIYCHYLSDKIPDMTLGCAVFMGALLGMTAVVGDLVESLFKREAGAKDSGTLFPGIGGILDLIDSLLFNAPIMYLFLRFMRALD